MDSLLRELHLLSAGAAQSVAAALIPAFRAAAGAEVHATFRTVGALKEMLLAAEPCDVLVSTAAMLDDFARDGRVLIGGTQVTEINATPGVTLAGTLPAPFELATTYAAAACTSAREPELAQRFVQMLAGPDALELRSQAGFEV